jgi:hypothetical protein
MLRFFRSDLRLPISDAQVQALVSDLPSRYRMIELQDRLIDQNDLITDVDEDWRKLTSGQRMLFLLAQFDMEVQNGGVEQYLWNSPDTIFELHDALVTLGEPQLVTAYESVLDKLTDNQESWVSLRERFSGASDEDLALFVESRELLDVDDFDDAWYGEWDGHGTQLAPGLGDLLAERMEQWIRAHPREFCTGRSRPSAGGASSGAVWGLVCPTALRTTGFGPLARNLNGFEPSWRTEVRRMRDLAGAATLTPLTGEDRRQI